MAASFLQATLICSAEIGGGMEGGGKEGGDWPGVRKKKYAASRMEKKKMMKRRRMIEKKDRRRIQIGSDLYQGEGGRRCCTAGSSSREQMQPLY